ncbi:MAG: pyridoxamine 5'-phosphate oxidase family protein [Pseudolabrys sp.]|nr:pyridoxamine 5'-phosphate oxidase family protein [Pseudolabrys sp.]MBV9953879.1 pyridoxamine 5'-phosphate oxidase family protein [Pseudolabrys sp.]
MTNSHVVESVAQLESLYGEPMPTALAKEIDHISQGYRALIEAAPFVIIATSGPDGLDCSPKGDMPGFVRIVDERTVMIPDRPGNNRLDGFKNLMTDPRIALLFLIPGVGETLRINGRGQVSVDPALRESFAVNGKPARAVLIVTIETIFFHCSKAIMRGKLWDAKAQIDRKSLPSTGTIIAELTDGKLGGAQYDKDAPARHKAMLY